MKIRVDFTDNNAEPLGFDIDESYEGEATYKGITINNKDGESYSLSEILDVDCVIVIEKI